MQINSIMEGSPQQAVSEPNNGHEQVLHLCTHFEANAIVDNASPTVPANASNVNYLPDLCLKWIFARVPVRDLFQVRRVCTRWRGLLRTVALSVRKLTLVIGGSNADFSPPLDAHEKNIVNDDDSQLYPQQQLPSWDSVHFQWLHMNALIGLTVTLPNVTTLEFAFTMRSAFQLVGVTILIRLWCTNLISFKLRVDSSFIRITEQAFGPLLDAINSLPLLRHLTLNFLGAYFSKIERVFPFGPNTVQLHLPILAQLNDFNFHSSDLTDVLINTIRTYAVSNAQLRLHLTYHCETFYMFDADVRPYYAMGHQFCSQFDRIHCIDLFRDVELEDYCSHFSSITTLDLIHSDGAIDEWPIQHIFQCLSQLTRLIHLKLFLNFDLDDEGENEEALPVLLSIKSFKLFAVGMSNHNDLCILNIPWTMPNVQALDVCVAAGGIGNRRCGVCEFDEAVDGQLITREQLMHCLSQTMFPFTDCKSLYTISVEIDIDDDEAISFENVTLEDLRQPLNIE